MPALKNHDIHTAILIGGAHSNNVLSALQLLIENGIIPILFLLGSPDSEMRGTHLLIRMLVESSSIHWVARDQWTIVEDLATQMAFELNRKGNKAIVIPEGCAMPEAIPGAATLALDILRNELEGGIVFDHIFLDAGTGFQSAITLLAYAWIERKTKFTIVSMADSKELFEENLKNYGLWFESWLQEEIPQPISYELIFPHTAKSFGSVNHLILTSLIAMARSEGVLVDPIYSAKLFSTAKHVLEDKFDDKKTLIVHSGGGLSLSGFQTTIAENIKEIDEPY